MIFRSISKILLKIMTKNLSKNRQTMLLGWSGGFDKLTVNAALKIKTQNLTKNLYPLYPLLINYPNAKKNFFSKRRSGEEIGT